jgi:teichuronic acid biosynthesis glycosyltransferase TuaC
MKILFLSSGNAKYFDNISPFIRTQGESLKHAGIDIRYFTIYGKGILGYLKAACELRKYVKRNPVDIIHAHYTLSGWSAVLSFSKRPIVLSLMGTDAYGQYIGLNKIKFSSRYLIVLTYLIQPFVKSIICKSKNIERSIILKKKSHIIPNGILLGKFSCYENGFKKDLNLDPGKKYALFLGNKKSNRKNFKLAESAVSLINSDNIILIAPYPVSHDQVVKYLNSVDVLVLTSLMEGSPNVIKEAMACNCPIVSTDVGDVRRVIGETDGCYITSFEPEEVAEKIKLAIEFSEKKGRTKGRERIIQLGLDSDTTAKKIIDVYKKALSQ